MGCKMCSRFLATNEYELSVVVIWCLVPVNFSCTASVRAPCSVTLRPVTSIDLARMLCPEQAHFPIFLSLNSGFYSSRSCSSILLLSPLFSACAVFSLDRYSANLQSSDRLTFCISRSSIDLPFKHCRIDIASLTTWTSPTSCMPKHVRGAG